MIDKNLLYIFICIAILTLSFLGIQLLYKKTPWIIGECSFNEKSSIFHERMLRGLGIIYPISITPIFFLNYNIIQFIDYLMLISLTIVGFIDDKYGLNYKIKIIFFIFISFTYNFLISSDIENIYIFKIFLNSGLLIFLIIFFNQIDGINGLAIITFLITFLFINVLNNSILLFLPLIFFSLPYLYYNLKGKIGIQGDTGSYFLAGIVFISFQNYYHNVYNILILIFFICPLFLDLVSTTIVKMCFKQNIFAGHKDNIYQKIVSHTKNHLISTSFFSIIQIMFGLITILLFKSFNLKTFIITMMLIVSISFIFVLYTSFLIQKNKIFRNNNET